MIPPWRHNTRVISSRLQCLLFLPRSPLLVVQPLVQLLAQELVAAAVALVLAQAGLLRHHHALLWRHNRLHATAPAALVPRRLLAEGMPITTITFTLSSSNIITTSATITTRKLHHRLPWPSRPQPAASLKAPHRMAFMLAHQLPPTISSSRSSVIRRALVPSRYFHRLSAPLALQQMMTTRLKGTPLLCLVGRRGWALLQCWDWRCPLTSDLDTAHWQAYPNPVDPTGGACTRVAATVGPTRLALFLIKSTIGPVSDAQQMAELLLLLALLALPVLLWQTALQMRLTARPQTRTGSGSASHCYQRSPRQLMRL